MKSTLGMVLALLTLLELTFSSQVAFAANDITRLVPFQGRLHGGDNKIVSDGTYDLTFYIYETPTGGTSLWTETHPSVSVIHGYVNVLLGAISPMVESNYANQSPLYSEAKNTVNFAEQKYLGISINGGAEMFPRSQLVPTFHAYTANHATHATQADNADNLGDKAANTYAQVSYVNNADGVLNSKIDDNITNVTTALNAKFNGDKAKDADLFDGLNSTSFLISTAKAVDADKLDNLNSTDFLRSTAKAVDADKLDNLNSTDFLRSGGKAVDADKLDGLDNTYFRNASNLNTGTIATARLPATNRISMNATTNVSDSYGHLYIGDMLIQYGRRASVGGNTYENITIKCYSTTNTFVITASYSNSSMDEPDAATTYKNSNCSIRLNNPLGAARAIEWMTIGRKL
ncbi:MAG: hypothetical protein ACI910_002328 [Oleispira sp.]|jgi:hypothetical protein